MSDEIAAALTAARRAMSIRELCHYWSKEQDIDPQWLALRILEAALDGQLDTVPLGEGDTGPGLLVIEKGATWDTIGRDIKVQIDAAANAGCDTSVFLERLVNDHTLGIRKEAVWQFCRSRRIKAPSFWPIPREPLPPREEQLTRPTSDKKKEMHEYLLAKEPKSMTRDEMIGDVRQHFKVSRDVARATVNELPKGHRFTRGEKRYRPTK
jgi:hypothetical protein